MVVDSHTFKHTNAVLMHSYLNHADACCEFRITLCLNWAIVRIFTTLNNVSLDDAFLARFITHLRPFRLVDLRPSRVFAPCLGGWVVNMCFHEGGGGSSSARAGSCVPVCVCVYSLVDLGSWEVLAARVPGQQRMDGALA